MTQKSYPNLDRWIVEHGGRIAIGYDEMNPSGSMAQLMDEGGTYWEGKTHYDGIDEVLAELDRAAANVLAEIYRN